ncbi:arylamine N-acetyltransferase family protein [Streptomyces pseudovenezuelae]|uniref:arylamine N-acetyltransferase family protein n=1 Tax=Streptomyces pseudovenezuelae TaxID=67350 RepID=UPI002E7FBD94|nr:arylamine N-acetyltransferase [Streptomyces pseudovenezuelae]WUA88761.1 arylamine N-acetyltransferase [Streptomyces pseudovenezuelae]
MSTPSSVFDLDAYARRIGYSGPFAPTQQVLRDICRAHALSVPFESLDAMESRLVLQDDLLFDKVVTDRRGGACFENHTLFHRVLREIGFDVSILGAYMWRPHHAEYSRVYAHMLLKVRLEETDWLVDVSFSHDTFIEPVPYVQGEFEQRGWRFRVSGAPGVPGGEGVEGDCDVVERRGADGQWVPLYKFAAEPREVREFQECLDYLSGPDSRSQIMNTLICARTLPEGKLTVINDLLITSRPGEESVRRLRSAEEASAFLDLIFEDHAPLSARARRIWRERFGTEADGSEAQGRPRSAEPAPAPEAPAVAASDW